MDDGGRGAGPRTVTRVSEPSYLRWPSVSGDLVCFVADDDVWAVPLGGGRAWRICADGAAVSSPRLSPDGATVAWTSVRRAGAPEVLTAPADGGTARRLTWWGAGRTAVTAWLSPAELAVVTTAGEHSGSVPVAVALPVAGGPARPLPWGRVGAAAVRPGGAGVLVSTPQFGEPATRKRYRGGTASRLWLDRSGDGAFERLLPDLTAPLGDPVWSGDRIGFTSDHDGVAQLWSAPVPAPGSAVLAAELHRHTAGDFYARHASGDGTRVVWCSAGQLWVLDDLDPASGAQPRRLAVTLGGPRRGRAPHRVAGRGAVGAAEPDATGRAALLEVRGTVQWLPQRDGPVRVLAAGSDVRRRLPVMLGDTGRVAWVDDADGADTVVFAAAGSGSVPGEGTRRLAAGELGDIESMTASPDGAVLAIASLDGRLSCVDVGSGGVAAITRSERGPVTGVAFSPDSRWLAWSDPGPAPLRSVRLVALAGAGPAGETVDVTGLRFADTDPVFTRDGRHLAFLSVRTFDALPDAVVFDRSFPAATRPYLVPLAATTPSPFDPSGDGRPAVPPSGPGPDPASGAGGQPRPDTPPAPPATTVDPAGIGDRIRPVPVRAGALSGLTAVEGGLVWLRATPAGELGSAAAGPDDTPDRPVLERVDLATGEVLTLSPGIDAVRVSGDGRRLLARDGEDLLVLPADHPAPPGPEAKPADRVVVDLGRVGVDVDPPAEWRQMYDEAGRRMASMFWRADLDGVDWGAQLARYRPLLDAAATRGDLVDVMYEAGGELATSHVYVLVDPDHDRASEVGLLGADLTRDADGTWRVARVLPGETSDPAARSPLAAPAVNVFTGDAVLAVGGRPVPPADGPNALLVGTVNHPVELTVRTGDAAPRTVTVVPVASETPLRYHDWVAANRARTREWSGGRLGYLHVPDMVGSGWAQLHRDLRVEADLEGLVVDTRENAGGELSPLVIERIAARVRAWDIARPRGAERYPAGAPRGPVVLLADEFAGSDGDIVNAIAQQMGIGPVVGERTWGGVIGYDEPHRLVGGLSVVQPSLSFWFDDARGWSVENHGVDPDVVVTFTPADRTAGRDPQLQRAVQLALERLAREPAAVPPSLPPPRRGRA